MAQILYRQGFTHLFIHPSNILADQEHGEKTSHNFSLRNREIKKCFFFFFFKRCLACFSTLFTTSLWSSKELQAELPVRVNCFLIHWHIRYTTPALRVKNPVARIIFFYGKIHHTTPSYTLLSCKPQCAFSLFSHLYNPWSTEHIQYQIMTAFRFFFQGYSYYLDYQVEALVLLTADRL